MSSRPTRGAAGLAAILDAFPDALLLVNSNGTVVDANKAAVESLQAPGTSLVGRGLLDLLPEFDPSRIPGSMRPAAAESEGLDKPVRMTARRTDGSSFPVEVSGNDFTDDGTGPGSGSEGRGFVPFDAYREGGGRDLLLLLVRDLTGRLGVEAELRRQHKQTEMILRAAAEGVLGVDLEGRVVLVNPAAAHILDYRASELGGRELHPLIQHSQSDGSPLALEGSALLDTLLSGRKHRVRGAVLWRKDGRPVTVDLTTAPVRDGEQLVGAVMTFTDRTKELALVARNEHLTAVLETELGDALTALHRRIDALAADPAGQLWPEANWTLRRLADECRRFGTLIDGVLDHQAFEVAAEAGKERLARKPVGLDSVVQRAVDHAGELVGPGRVRYSVHAAAVEVVADRERLARALAHLVADVSGITPSLDAPGTGPGPSLGVPALPPVGGDVPMVVVAAAQRGDVARIEVRGPARQSSPVHLPIARGTVERHGGVLQRHELPNAAGTTYVVELPIDPATARSSARRASVPAETDTAMLPDLPELPQREAGEGPDGATDRAADRGDRARRSRSGQPSAPTGDPEGNGADRSGPIALGPSPLGRGEAVPVVDDASTPPAGTPSAGPVDAPAADGPSNAPGAEDPARPSRRRRRAPAEEAAEAAAALPGLGEAGTVYPGLEHALPAGPPVAVPQAAQPTGRRRRLAVPADPEGAAQPAPALPAAQQDRSGAAPSAGLSPVRAALPEPASPQSGQPVGTGLGELSPPRPLQAAPAPALPGLPQPPVPQQAPAELPSAGQPSAAPELPALPASSAGPAPAEPRTPPRPLAELAPAGAPAPAVPVQGPDGGPRHLLVWPEPDPSTDQALRNRGYRPVIVRSREEVDAQASAFPAALFVDPLTGPITRTALESLRTAALNHRVPVMVTAGIGLAARNAAPGPDPAVLLRALAPRDSESHAPRVLLVEAEQEIAAAMIAGLERRGMHVEHAADEDEAVAKASSVQPNLVVMDLLRIDRHRAGLIDWLRANDRLHRTPLVVYTSGDIDPQGLPRLRSGETVLFLSERSTAEDVQGRIVDLLGRIGAMAEAGAGR